MKAKIISISSIAALLLMTSVHAEISASDLTEAKNVMRKACSARMAERTKEQKEEVSPELMGTYMDVCNCIIDDAKLIPHISALAEIDKDSAKGGNAEEIKKRSDKVEADFEKASDPIITRCATAHAGEMAKQSKPATSESEGSSKGGRGSDEKSNE